MNKPKVNFDAIAKDYDNDPRKKRAETFANEIRLHFSNASEKSAIEYGCGTGLVGFNFKDEFRSLLLADSSPGMIEEVKNKIADLGSAGAHISALCCDFTRSVPEGLTADYIFLSLSLHHIIDTAGIMKRFYNILNPGGHLIAVDINKDENSSFFHAHHPGFDGHDGFDKEQLEGLAAEAGFSKCRFKLFYFGSKIAEGKKMPFSFFIFDAEK